MRLSTSRLAVPAVAVLAVLVGACGGQYELGHHPNAGAVTLSTASLAQALTKCAGKHGTLLGADVSVYQGNIDWATASKTLKWAYAKATEGTFLQDRTFAANWKGMKAHGVPRGAYCFFHPSESGKAQADYFLKTVGKLGPNDLPPMLDWEVNDKVALSTGEANATAFIKEIRAKTGRQTIIYTSPGLWPKMSAKSYGSTPLWDAAWSYDRYSCPVLPSGWTSWVYWQWSNKGAVPGISGHVDLDVFNGNASELAALGGGSAPAPKPPKKGGGGTKSVKGLLEGIIFAKPKATHGLSGAKVVVGGHTLYTDGSGFYQVKLHAGTYTVTASDPGYQTGHRSRQVVAGSTTWGSIGLARPPQLTHGFLKGIVYRSPNAAHRLANATVKLSSGKVTHTNANGVYRFEVRPGSFTLTASKSGYVSRAIHRSVKAGHTVFGGIGLHKKSAKLATIKGVVYAYPNVSHRIAGAKVVLPNGDMITTGSNGYFMFRVPAGNWRVTASKSGYRTGHRRRPVAAGHVVWSSVGLFKASTSTTGTIVGVVYERGSSSHRIAFAKVTTSTGQSVSADAHGVFRIKGVRVGKVVITASKAGFTPGHVTRTVSAGRTVWGSVPLIRGATPTGGGGIVDAVLVAPAKNATVGSNPTFVWKNVTSAQMNGKKFSYYIEIYQQNASGFYDFSVAGTTGGQTSQNFKLSLDPGVWEWRVEAVPAGQNPQQGGKMMPFKVQ